jgi:hypothetical protein
MEQPTIENLELTTQQDGSTDTRRSAARIAVVQFNPQVGVENLECNMRAVTERLEHSLSARCRPHLRPDRLVLDASPSLRREWNLHGGVSANDLRSRQ